MWSISLLRRARRIVDHKRRLQRRVLRPEEVDPDCLPFEGSQIESLQHVPTRFIQVRVRRKSRQHRVAGIANLYLQPVECGGGCRLGCRDLQPETERHAGRARWNCYLLIKRIGVCCAITIKLGIPRAGSRCLPR